MSENSRMDGALHTIGETARLTGLPVSTIRYYSDEGLVPPAARSSGGYRLYDRRALHLLDLVRTLRDLGVDLSTITRVLTGAESFARVADRQAAALETQIQTLRVRQAVLRHAAAHNADPGTTAEVHRLARLSAEQRRRLVADLVAETTRGLDMEPGFAARLRSMLPDLPDEPGPERLGAWVELARLVGDPDFRTSVRAAFERHAADRASGADGGDPSGWKRAERTLLDLAGAALADGVAPGSADARAVAVRIIAAFADAHGRADDAGFRRWLAERIRIGADERVTRYRALIAVIDREPPEPDPVPAGRWFLAALEAAPLSP
ncbi:helix-turn-helix domain-containing protein [Actinomadura algeriensis]|uniref:DNA-binding transcriptional MerR regulator n=1 Tax=Actinomadura algeriensis TaxID=1679523 RepID=A0ABR9K590_9ACTN|nr:MerR family transcriptional regulator [Actinomadura algeriensis]MBE1537997.1 DNA-binding transcriptional MerR regulator [Actinomadura algeriensis]